MLNFGQLWQRALILNGFMVVTAFCSASSSSNEWEVKRITNVGYPQNELPVPITPCQFKQLPIFEDSTIFHGAAAEPTIAVNPQNPCNIVAAWEQDRISDAGALEAGIAYTFDGGHTWKRTTIPFNLCIGGFVNRVSNLWLGFSNRDVSDGQEPELYLVGHAFNITQDTNTLDQQGITVNVSKDGGRTWEQRQWLGTSQDAFNAPNSGNYPFDTKPSVTADPLNPNIAYAVRTRFDCFSCVTSTHGPTLFNRTVDSGQTWSSFEVIYDPPADTSILPLIPQSTYNNLIVVRPDGVLVNFMSRVIFNPATPDVPYYDIALIKSTDQGLTWDTEATIIVPPVASQPNGLPTVFTGGYTYAINGDRTGGVGTLMRTSAEDDDPPITFDATVDREKGTLYVVFQTTQFRSDFLPQIGLTLSRDGGNTWTCPVRVNRTPQNSENPQAFTPSIAVTKDHHIGILYSDFRSDTGVDPDRTLTNTWLAIYKRKGKKLKFKEEVQTSSQAFVAQNGPLTTGGTMTNGDYQSLVTGGKDGNTFYAASTQSHEGPFVPPILIFTDEEYSTQLFVDDNYRQSPYVTIVKRHCDESSSSCKKCSSSSSSTTSSRHPTESSSTNTCETSSSSSSTCETSSSSTSTCETSSSSSSTCETSGRVRLPKKNAHLGRH